MSLLVPILILSLPVLYFAPPLLLFWSIGLYRSVPRRRGGWRRLGRAFPVIALTHLVASLTGAAHFVEAVTRLPPRSIEAFGFYGLLCLSLLIPATALAALVWPAEATVDPVPGLESYHAASMLSLTFCLGPSFALLYFIAHV